MNSDLRRSSSAPAYEPRYMEAIDESAIEESDEQNPDDTTTDLEQNPKNLQVRRRSSAAQRWNSIKQFGGPNSIDNFARSLQRSANFREITPVRKRSVFVESLGNDDENLDVRANLRRQSSGRQQRSLLSQQLAEGYTTPPTRQIRRVPQPPESSSETLRPEYDQSRSSSTPQFRVSFEDGNFASNYGSVSSLLTPNAQRRASVLAEEQLKSTNWIRRDSKEYIADYSEQRLEFHHDEDGEVIARVVGHSTVPMTIFNMVNSLVGIGMLALPLGFYYTGWVLGLLLFTAAALTTYYTAILLTKCLDTNTGSMTYGDISYLAFGPWGRSCVESLFFFELLVAGTGLIVLFGDSLHQLVPSVGVHIWQAVIAVGLLPLNFAPFRYLSLTSILGILCTIGLIAMVLTDGLIKPSQPGSLREIAKTDILPSNLHAIPLSIGLFMSPWGGHPIIPAVYRDMRHPAKFRTAARTGYVASYILDISMAVLGYLMFGAALKGEVTAGILQDSFYPASISLLIIFLIALVSTTKLPLATRPIIDTIGSKFEAGLDEKEHGSQSEEEPLLASEPAPSHGHSSSSEISIGRTITAILVNLVELCIAIAFPSFDSIMALLGSAFCITICVILPVSFYLKIFSSGISLVERVFCVFLILVAAGLAVLGTVYAVLPREGVGL